MCLNWELNKITERCFVLFIGVATGEYEDPGRGPPIRAETPSQSWELRKTVAKDFSCSWETFTYSGILAAPLPVLAMFWFVIQRVFSSQFASLAPHSPSDCSLELTLPG